jgi:hypothetical protein
LEARLRGQHAAALFQLSTEFGNPGLYAVAENDVLDERVLI